MGNSRYFYSFIITAILYTLFLYGALNLDFKKEQKKDNRPKIVKISLLEPTLPTPKRATVQKKEEKKSNQIAPIPLLKKPKIKPKPKLQSKSKNKPKPKPKIKKKKRAKSLKQKKKRVSKRVTKKRLKRATKRIIKKDKTKIRKSKHKKIVKHKSKIKKRYSKKVQKIKKTKPKAKTTKITHSYKKKVIKSRPKPKPTPEIIEEYVEYQEYIPKVTHRPRATPIRYSNITPQNIDTIKPATVTKHSSIRREKHTNSVSYSQPSRVSRSSNTRVKSRDLSGEKRAFLSSIRESINSNKIYPKRAKRMGLEGVVRVTFDIDSSGNVSNIRATNAPNILKRAVIKAVKNSFPVAIPSNLSSLFPMRNISVKVYFKLR